MKSLPIFQLSKLFYKLLEIRRDELLPAAVLEVHFKLFGTDGVSLQSRELSKELKKRGWKIFAAASDLPDTEPGLRLEELSYQSAEAQALSYRIFPNMRKPDADALAYVRMFSAMDDSQVIVYLYEKASSIERKIEQFLDSNAIRFVHIRNILSLPLNLPASP